MPNDDDSLPIPIPPPRSQTPISHIPSRPPFTRLDREPAAAIVDLGIALPRQTSLFEAVGDAARGYVRQEEEPQLAPQPERTLKRTPQMEVTTNEGQPKPVQSQTQSISWARWDTCREISKRSVPRVGFHLPVPNLSQFKASPDRVHAPCSTLSMGLHAPRCCGSSLANRRL